MKLILSYRRVQGDLSTGEIRTVDDQDEDLVWTNFVESEWRLLTQVFARAVAAFPDVKDVYVQRTDHPGLIALKLKEEEVELWRRDPIQAMRFWELPRDLRQGTAPSSTASIQPVQEVTFPLLRAGQETIAQCFGEIVYTRLRDADAECFGCGHWRPHADPMLCSICGSFPLQNPHNLTEWVGVHVPHLLSTPLDRFYLPRAWNKHGKWITRAELTDKYNEYRFEKENLLS